MVTGIVRAEHAENELRKDLTDRERVAIARAVKEEAEKKERRERPATENIDEKIPGPDPELTKGQDTRDIVAQKVGWSIASYLRVTGASIWEYEYDRCADQLPRLKGSGQEWVMTVIFPFLGATGCAVALGLDCLRGDCSVSNLEWPIVVIAGGLCYCVLTCSREKALRRFSNLFDDDWKKVKEGEEHMR